MNKLIKITLGVTLALSSTLGFAQDEEESELSNIQKFTPSKLLAKGQWDIKTFNSVYTQTRKTDSGSSSESIPRETFFTSTNEIYTGISNNSRLNVGLIFQIRSNTTNGRGPFSVFKFQDNLTDARTGFTTIAPSIKFQPIASLSNFSITSSFFIPIFEDVATNDLINDALFLDQRSFVWENRFFYDHTFGGGRWQVFTEVNVRYNFGDAQGEANSETENVGERFANDSIFLPVSAFLSYFPTSDTTVFINAQQLTLIDIDNDFSQDGTAVGFGAKYQINKQLNLEVSYSNIVRGNNFQGLGQTFGLGLRYLL